MQVRRVIRMRKLRTKGDDSVESTITIIDTDPGIDDAAALGLAFTQKTLDIRLITTVGGNVSLAHVTHNVLRLLKFFDKEIPVAKGSACPLVRTLVDARNIHGEDGLDGFCGTETNDNCLVDVPAVQAMHDVLVSAGAPVDIITLGPLTNVALLIRAYPDSTQYIRRIVSMGGSFGRGNIGVLSEFNIANDPEASYIVMHAGIPFAMVGLEIGNKAALLEEDLIKLRETGRAGNMIADLFVAYRSRDNGKIAMYDPSCMAYAIKPELFTLARTYVDVELRGEHTAGATLVDFENRLKQQPNADVTVDVDAGAFRAWFIEQYRKLG